jgi:hypothetical protein
MSRTYTTRDGAFQYGYVRKPSDMAGTMQPFRPHWWAQKLSNGAWEIFDSRERALAWIKDWDKENDHAD